MKANPLLLISLYFFCFPTLAGLNSLLSSMSGGGMSKLRRQICTWSAPCFFTVSWESGTGGTEKTLKEYPSIFIWQLRSTTKVDAEIFEAIIFQELTVCFVPKHSQPSFSRPTWMSKSVHSVIRIQFWFGMGPTRLNQYNSFKGSTSVWSIACTMQPAPGFR